MCKQHYNQTHSFFLCQPAKTKVNVPYCEKMTIKSCSFIIDHHTEHFQFCHINALDPAFSQFSSPTICLSSDSPCDIVCQVQMTQISCCPFVYCWHSESPCRSSLLARCKDKLPFCNDFSVLFDST